MKLRKENLATVSIDNRSVLDLCEELKNVCTQAEKAGYKDIRVVSYGGLEGALCFADPSTMGVIGHRAETSKERERRRCREFKAKEKKRLKKQAKEEKERAILTRLKKKYEGGGGGKAA